MTDNQPKLLLGSHISLNKANQYLLGVVSETIGNDANCFMIFTGAPQNKRRIPVNDLLLSDALKLASEHKIDFSQCVVHAPYIVNLPGGVDDDDSMFAVDFLIEEISRTVQMGIKYFVLHPGYHNKSDIETGIKNLCINLQKILDRTKELDYYICLETMAGKKNQIGKSFEEFVEIFKQLKQHPKLAICLDTCHLHDAGYDLSDKDGFIQIIKDTVGLERVKVIHLGDSMNARGSSKDRHANLGYGQIGFETLLSYAYDDYISKIPIIIETPYWLDDHKKLISPYKHEISLIKNKEFSKVPYKNFSPIYDHSIL